MIVTQTVLQNETRNYAVCWKSCFLKIHNQTLKWLQIRIVTEVTATSALKKMGIAICEQCTLCDDEKGSMEDFLWQCYFTRCFWQDWRLARCPPGLLFRLVSVSSRVKIRLGLGNNSTSLGDKGSWGQQYGLFLKCAERFWNHVAADGEYFKKVVLLVGSCLQWREHTLNDPLHIKTKHPRIGTPNYKKQNEKENLLSDHGFVQAKEDWPGNIYTGATPPWLMQEDTEGSREIGPTADSFKKHCKWSHIAFSPSSLKSCYTIISRLRGTSAD